MVGSLPRGVGQKKLLLVTMDNFRKWVEVVPLGRIKEYEVIPFIWKKIICHFSFPKEIVTANGKQFINYNIKEFA